MVWYGTDNKIDDKAIPDHCDKQLNVQPYPDHLEEKLLKDETYTHIYTHLHSL